MPHDEGQLTLTRFCWHSFMRLSFFHVIYAQLFILLLLSLNLLSFIHALGPDLNSVGVAVTTVGAAVEAAGSLDVGG